MPRAQRILVEGGLYHVYNRFARGEEIFSDPEEAIEILDLVRDFKQRDGLQVFAWSLLSNHYHLALRTPAVPLSRTLRTPRGPSARRSIDAGNDQARYGKTDCRAESSESSDLTDPPPRTTVSVVW